MGELGCRNFFLYSTWNNFDDPLLTICFGVSGQRTLSARGLSLCWLSIAIVWICRSFVDLPPRTTIYKFTPLHAVISHRLFFWRANSLSSLCDLSRTFSSTGWREDDAPRCLCLTARCRGTSSICSGTTRLNTIQAHLLILNWSQLIDSWCKYGFQTSHP